MQSHLITGDFAALPTRVLRSAIESQIAEMIDLLDVIDGDADLEENGDREPYIGLPNNTMCRTFTSYGMPTSGTFDDLEQDNADYEPDADDEDGHDAEEDRSDYEPDAEGEPSLGWGNTDAPKVNLGGTSIMPPGDLDDADPATKLFLEFNGTGHHIGRQLLRQHVKNVRLLDAALARICVSPGYGA